MLPLHCDIQTFIEYAVAPYVGAWIETEDVDEDDNTYKSHPTWVRGLKHSIDDNTLISLCRTLRGCVD